MYKHTVTFTSDRNHNALPRVQDFLETYLEATNVEYTVESPPINWKPGDVVRFRIHDELDRVLTAVRTASDNFHDWVDSEGDGLSDETVVPYITEVIIREGVVQK